MPSGCWDSPPTYLVAPIELSLDKPPRGLARPSLLPIAPVLTPQDRLGVPPANFRIILRGASYPVVGLPPADWGYAGFLQRLSDKSAG